MRESAACGIRILLRAKSGKTGIPDYRPEIPHLCCQLAAAGLHCAPHQHSPAQKLPRQLRSRPGLQHAHSPLLQSYLARSRDLHTGTQ